MSSLFQALYPLKNFQKFMKWLNDSVDEDDKSEIKLFSQIYLSIVKWEINFDGIKRLSNHLIKKRKSLMKKEDPHELLLHFLSRANRNINRKLEEERKSIYKNSST